MKGPTSRRRPAWGGAYPSPMRAAPPYLRGLGKELSQRKSSGSDQTTSRTEVVMVVIILYLDDNTSESVNIRHLGRAHEYYILCHQNFRRNPTKGVVGSWGGSVPRIGVDGN